MGCGSGQKQQAQSLRLQTVNGIMRVTIVNAKIQHETSSFFSMDPYIKLKFSNQSVTSKIISKGGKSPVFNKSFQFFVNSCFKANGRFIQIELWDQNKTSDSLIGYGITDIDPILNSKQHKRDMRMFLNYETKPAGVINAVVEFKDQPVQLLSFRFQTASIRRKTSSMGNMNCFVQVTIGEQVLKTKKQKDTNQMPPVWTDQVITFNALKIIKNCLIQLFDDDKLVGQCTMTVEDLLKQTKEKQYDQELMFKDTIAGTLRFQTIMGVNPQFSQIKRDYKRKPQEKKQVKKQGDTKQSKQNPEQKGKKQQTKPQANSKIGELPKTQNKKEQIKA